MGVEGVELIKNGEMKGGREKMINFTSLTER